MQYTDVGVRHQMGPQAQALHLQAAHLPAQAAWALASSQPDQRTQKHIIYSSISHYQTVKYDVQCLI